MGTRKLTPLILLIVFSFVLGIDYISACTLIKITIDGKTIVGNNEDFGNPDTRIWFEPGDKKHYGAIYVGYNNLFPQGGVNEAGLVFDAFGVSDKPLKDTVGKEPFFWMDFKSKIMRECKTVDQVNALLKKYNHDYWSHAVWLFIDKSGKYLAVEGDNITMGKNDYYVQTNFRQSEIIDKNKIDCWRYKKAMALLKNHSESSINYCTALMDSVHQDNTQYTTAYDLDKGIMYLYYLHDYNKVKVINLKEELKKGERVIPIPELFPNVKNESYLGCLNLKSAIDSLLFLHSSTESLKIFRIKSGLKKLGYLEPILENYGYELLHQDKFEKALSVFNLIIDLLPQSAADAYDYLGEAYMENKQYRLALENYSRSVELDPNNTNGKHRIYVLKKLITQ